MSSMFGGSWAMPPRARSPGAAARPIVHERLELGDEDVDAARESASSGVIVPSVSISIVSLSKLVSWPTRMLVDPVVDLADGREDRVDGDHADRQRLGPIGAEVADAALDGQVDLDR